LLSRIFIINPSFKTFLVKDFHRHFLLAFKYLRILLDLNNSKINEIYKKFNYFYINEAKIKD